VTAPEPPADAVPSRMLVNRPSDYLMAIWLLAHPVGPRPKGARRAQPTAPARIAEHLGVSRPAVGEMLTKLEARDLVERGPRKEALLTSEGRAEAMRVIRRHRLVERFLADTLGYLPWQIHEHLGTLPDAFEPAALERLYERLGQPERCPHGFPIDPDHELRENPTLVPLSSVEPGRSFVLVRVAEPARALQEQLHDHGLELGGAFDRQASDEEVFVIGQGRKRRFECGSADARSLLVRPVEVPEVPAHASCWADILRRERSLAAT
jgi:DtxR family transcriptional regulator, Mn-dependent transcriptional regulator